MTPTGSKKEKPIIDPKVVAASEYVMKNDSVIAEWSKASPSHFIRLVEDLVEWHNSECIALLEELEKERVQVLGELKGTNIFNSKREDLLAVPLSAIQKSKENYE